jgi:hypothetical protein
MYLTAREDSPGAVGAALASRAYNPVRQALALPAGRD